MTEENAAYLEWLERHQGEVPPSVRQSVQESLRRNAVYLSEQERRRLDYLLGKDRRPA